MTIATILLAPFVLLLPAPGQVDAVSDDRVQLEKREVPAPEPEDLGPFSAIAHSFRARSANQVRIEQRMTIRIAPRPVPVQPNFLVDLPARAVSPRFVERKIGKCLPVAGIAGVQADRQNRLLLFMRDRRIVSAALERACRAQDFYSGFYMSRTGDGQLCVDRDALQSRSGANCKLTRLRQLIESED